MDSSIFARLSPEIRNQIYEYTFLSRFKLPLADGETQHALTKTCRQIRRETLEMYYSLTRFNAHLDDRPSFPLTSWLKAVGPENALLLRELHVWGSKQNQGFDPNLRYLVVLILSALVHDLSFSVHADGSRPEELDGSGFILAPTATYSLETMRYLKAVLATYESMGLTLLQYCREIPLIDPENLSSLKLVSELCSWFTVTRRLSN